MRVQVLLFAQAKDLVGAAALEAEVADGACIADFRCALANQAPALAPLLNRSVFAINERYATDVELIPPNAVIALIPPVSGG